MKSIEEQQSSTINDTCNDCGSFVDIGTVLDEQDTCMTLSFSGVDAEVKAKELATLALARFPGCRAQLETEANGCRLVLQFDVSAEKLIFALDNGLTG
ncbi:DUF406 family protein [Shewanella sedimentimangrovi]|uniref:DUF406 family protein n=1 Tax=Shewanella sedimentimangrovi TaxID=2814293 RepID=A0ABX7R4U0_9GAMM|nr:DUF406 family protein [Shewanella sedimentimangrovi]QSX38862.1 DUF406 family protein [Shewanella sedimentimangrovi]